MLLWNLPCKIKVETLSSSSWSNIRETVTNPKELISSCFSCSKKNATYLLLKFSWQLERQDICYLNLPRNFAKSKFFALQFWRISNFWRYWELPRKFDWQMKMARYLLFWSCNLPWGNRCNIAALHRKFNLPRPFAIGYIATWQVSISIA